MHLRFKTTQPILGRNGRDCHPFRCHWSVYQPVLCIWLSLVLGDAMNKEQEALKLARAYLRWIVLGISTTDGVDGQATSGVEVDKAIEEALAQPAQEPDELTIAYMSGLYDGKKKRPWVGLTDDKLTDLWYKESRDWMEFARAHEAALKEKNT